MALDVGLDALIETCRTGKEYRRKQAKLIVQELT
jgi:hypothetical protein